MGCGAGTRLASAPRPLLPMSMQHARSQLLLSVLFCALAPGCEQHDAAAPEHAHGAAAKSADGAEEHPGVLEHDAFEFLEPQHPGHPNWVDMGDIPLGEVREATVRMRNVEGVPIRIEQVTAGCSCTRPQVTVVLPSGERVPGDSNARDVVALAPPDSIIEVTLRVDSTQAPVKNKDKIVLVRMTTDSKTSPYVTLEARMKIHAPLQPVPPEIDLERLGINAGKEGRTDITPVVPTGEKVLGVLETPEGLTARIEPIEISGIPVWRLHVRVEAPVRPGYQEQYIKLSTSGPSGFGEGRPLSVKVRWFAAEDVEVAPPRLLFVRQPQSTVERAVGELITHMPGHKLKVTSHRVEGVDASSLNISIEPREPDADGRAKAWSISLERTAGANGALSGSLVLELDDVQHPRLEVPLIGRG